MWAWLASFFVSKAVPEIKHAIWRTISVICVLGAIGFFIYAGWRIFHPKPTSTTTVQSGGVAYTYDIKVGFGGCVRLPTKR
jgi:TRAP-type C4-dicarboxylate transport system permease small subunit